MQLQEQKLEIEKAALAQQAKESNEKSKREGLLLDQVKDMQAMAMNIMQQQQNAGMMMILEKVLNSK